MDTTVGAIRTLLLFHRHQRRRSNRLQEREETVLHRPFNLLISFQLCAIKQKWVYLGKCETFEAEINIRNAAMSIYDEDLRLKLGNYQFGAGPDFAAMEVMYHHQCKREYLNKSRDYKQARKDALSKDKKAKGAATKDLVHFVHSSVLGQIKPIQVSNLLDRYKKVYASEGGCTEKINSYNVQNFAEKLRKLFSDSLLSVKADSTKKMIAWKGEGMSFQLASEEAKSHSSQSDSLIWDCVMRLRNEILHLISEP